VTILTNFFARFQALPALGKVRLLLGVFALGLGLYVLFAKKPWSVAVEPGESLRLRDYVTIYFWVAAAANLVLVGVLAATATWWMRPLSSSFLSTLLPSRAPKWFWPLVIVAMALTAWTGWPRLGQSIWHDEAYPIRRTIVGAYKEQPDATLKLDPVTWKETFFYFKKPNHVLHSVICRVFNDTWRTFARPEGLQFSETAIRLPTYLAGIAGVATLALLLLRLGFPFAGVIAAFLAALHPWYLRYASEARSYAFVLCLLPLLLYFFLQAIRRGQWRWWLAFAVTEFLLMAFYPTCAYVLVVLNLCAPVILWRQAAVPRDRQTLGMRWLVANLLAGMAFLQMTLPIVPQLLLYLKEVPALGQVDYRWMQNFLAHLLSGSPWSYTFQYKTPYLELFPWAVDHPGLMVLIVFLAAAFFILGARRLAAKGFLECALILTMLMPAVLCFIQVRASGGHMYEWYVIFILPGAIALTALGMDGILAAAHSRPARLAALMVVVFFLGSYAVWTAPQRTLLMSRSMQPNRESVELTRKTLDPLDPSQKAILTATFFGEPFPYDPNIIVFRSMSSFEKLIRRADAEQKQLFINLGYLVTVEGEHFNKYRFLKDSGLFEDWGLLRGMESLQSRHVFRYKPGSAADFDFATVPADPGSPGRTEK
jgi:hypothetical protein